MGLNLPNAQVTVDQSLPVNEVQTMTNQLREGVVVKKPVAWSGKVESDEVCILLNI
jgi:hypothetical protein